MKLLFLKIEKNNIEGIKVVYNILKNSGENMYLSKGLEHWKKPYSIKAIEADTQTKDVYIVEDIDTKEYVHTFQLEITKLNDSNISKNYTTAHIHKFATIPTRLGLGIGSISLKYIEEMCVVKSVNKLILDVYDKSLDAITFYTKKGFVKTGEKKTKYFTVLTMEKTIDL